MRLDSVVQFLDRVFEILMRAGILFVLGIAAYVVIQLLFGGAEPAQSRSGKVLIMLNDNWRAALLFTLPIFYRPLVALINRIRSISIPGGSFQTEPDRAETPGP